MSDTPKLTDAVEGDSVHRLVHALCGQALWIPDGQGGFEKHMVNNIVFRTVPWSERKKHPSACGMHDTFVADVRLQNPGMNAQAMASADEKTSTHQENV